MKFKIIANAQTPAVDFTLSAEDTININKNMIAKFLSFARRQTNCCGLAANQVSCDGERIMSNFFVHKINHFWDIVICPDIMAYQGIPKEVEEGCLTWLGRIIVVERYPIIDVVYYTFKGEKIRRTISGVEAQIWQHEYNHLKGVAEKFKYAGDHL